MNLADDQQVQTAVERLQERLRTEIQGLGEMIDARVRYEQRRDQLTGLGNDRALQETITDAIPSKNFWVAFVEVDKFKRINDEFGYQNADRLLEAIARLLGDLVHCFPRGAVAFRAHGDEFYLFGEVLANSEHVLETIARELERVCRKVEGLALVVSEPEPHAEAKSSRVMRCTVSVGWATSTDVTAALGTRGESLTARGTLICLEQAVGEAKHQGRNRVVRYSLDHAKDPLDSPRGDCEDCRCKFSFDVRRTTNRVAEDFYCPNCGARVSRGALSSPPPLGPQPGVVHLDPIDVTAKA
jgi:diguanylate cyclase (GGDEF)-like protein